MRIYLACVLTLLLAACGSGKSKPSGDTSDNDKWSTNGVKRENTSGSNKSGNSNGSNSGSANGAGNSVKEPEPEPEPVVEESVARTDIEGKITEFSHVIALWDEVNHSVRFIACTQ